MNDGRARSVLILVLMSATMLCINSAAAGDVLPSWNDGKARQSILDFVAKVTTPGTPEFVPPAE